MEKSGRSLAQFYELLFKLDKRITSLEKDCTFIEKKIISIGKDRIDKYNILGIELNDLRASLVNVKKSIRTNVIGLIKISSDMQGAVKKTRLIN
jgi:hypothetical protein